MTNKILILFSTLIFTIQSCTETQPKDFPQFHEKLSIVLYRQHCDDLSILENKLQTGKADSLYVKLSEITDSACAYIDTLLKVILLNTNQIDPISNEVYNYEDLRKELTTLDSILAYKSPSLLLIGPDPASPISDNWSAIQLKKRILKFNSDFENLTGRPPVGLNVDFDKIENNIKVSWEVGNFYHMPLIEILRTLKNLQIKLRENQYAEKIIHSA